MLYIHFNFFFLKTILLLLVFLPLVCSLLLGFRSKYNYCHYDSPRNLLYIFWFFIFFLLLLVLFSVFCFFYKLDKNFLIIIDCGIWFSTTSYSIHWNFIFDFLSVSMFFIVYIVSGLVHIYSLSYMKHDPYLLKFLSYLSLFTFFMVWLVSSGNLVQLFIGWEGVGLCSFLLISFWTERLSANKAAVKAMVVNKFGDSFLLLGIAFLLQSTGTVDIFKYCLFINDSFFFMNFYTLLHLQTSWFGFSLDLVSTICFFLFLGVMAKSAQFGFHTWLPDAMEGPTPVSALIHAATMVTAGVFLLLRLSLLFSLSPFVQFFMIVVGVITMLFAGSVALFQNDIKRVIAYSTCSQLGYMVTACGFSFYGAAFFHLLSHAFFKALLFLGAGAIIHFFNDEQDMRKMGGSLLYNPVTFVCMFVASLALLGFPYTSGFYSKDFLLELLYFSTSEYSFYGYFFALFVACLTSFYSFRLLYLVFLGCPSGIKFNFVFAHLEDFRISFVLIVLFFFTLFFGFFYKFFFSTFISFSADNSLSVFVHVPYYIKFLPFFSIFVGLFFFFIYYFKRNILYFFSPFFFSLYSFLVNRWYFDILQNYLFVFSSYLFSFSADNSLSVFVHVPYYIKFLPFFSIFVGLFFFFFFFFKRNILYFFSPFFFSLYSFLVNRWYFDILQNYLFVFSSYLFSFSITYSALEKGWIEFFGPSGSVCFFNFISRQINNLQTLNFFDYLFYFFSFLLGIFFFL